MSEKVKSNFSYLIETKEYPREIIKILKEENIPFEITKCRELERGIYTPIEKSETVSDFFSISY